MVTYEKFLVAKQQILVAHFLHSTEKEKKNMAARKEFSFVFAGGRHFDWKSPGNEVRNHKMEEFDTRARLNTW